MFQITNEYPAHPAGSFNYPDKKSLPTIATFSFVKEKEYELSEVFNLKRDRHMIVPQSKVNKYSYEVDNNEKLDNSIVTFVPSSSPPSTTEPIKDEIMEDNDLLSAVKMNPKGPGYHSSGGPTDFLKKKYNSAMLEVKKSIIFAPS